MAPYLSALGGQATDLGSSKMQHGYQEGNGLLGGTPGLIASKLAKAMGYITGATGAIPAAINLSQPNLK